MTFSVVYILLLSNLPQKQSTKLLLLSCRRRCLAPSRSGVREDQSLRSTVSSVSISSAQRYAGWGSHPLPEALTFGSCTYRHEITPPISSSANLHSHSHHRHRHYTLQLSPAVIFCIIITIRIAFTTPHHTHLTSSSGHCSLIRISITISLSTCLPSMFFFFFFFFFTGS
jgi:hypothetical protein